MKLLIHIILLIIGASLFATGLVIFLLIPTIVRQKVGEMLPLKNGSFVYDQWQNPTLPTYIQFWFFVVLNPEEIYQGEKPALHQIGPYTYLEHRIKHNISFNSDTSVNYLQRRSFYFDRDKSVGDENDIFTTVNIPLVSIGRKIRNLDWLTRNLIDAFVRNIEPQGLFMKVSVKNITWGYIDPVLKDLAEFVKRFHLNFQFNPLVGLFAGKNNSDDEIYQVDSGNVNLDNFLSIRTWNGSDSLPIWNDRYANMINGTDGSMFAPFLNRSSTLYIFQSDICRSIYTTFVEATVVKGIPALKFLAPDRVFANHTENPDNEGFCLDGYCLGAGMLNLSGCIADAPVVMSQPHFLGAAAKYIDAVVGITPSDEDRTMLRLEPTTGLPLHVEKKLQINVALEPVANFMRMDKVPTVIVPMMWLNESALISDDLVDTLRAMLLTPQAIAYWLTVALMALGALVFVATLLALALKIRDMERHNESDPLIVNEDKETLDTI